MSGPKYPFAGYPFAAFKTERSLAARQAQSARLRAQPEDQPEFQVPLVIARAHADFTVLPEIDHAEFLAPASMTAQQLIEAVRRQLEQPPPPLPTPPVASAWPSSWFTTGRGNEAVVRLGRGDDHAEGLQPVEEAAALRRMVGEWRLSPAGVEVICAARVANPGAAAAAAAALFGEAPDTPAPAPYGLSCTALLAAGSERTRLEAALGSKLSLGDWKAVQKGVAEFPQEQPSVVCPDGYRRQLWLVVDPVAGKPTGGQALAGPGTGNTTMLDCWTRHRDDDGYLYVVYSTQPRAALCPDPCRASSFMAGRLLGVPHQAERLACAAVSQEANTAAGGMAVQGTVMAGAAATAMCVASQAATCAEVVAAGFIMIGALPTAVVAVAVLTTANHAGGEAWALEEKAREHWVPDSERTTCSGCLVEFALLTRRHHCRGCGEVFCHSCAPLSTGSLTFGKRLRTCRNCAARVHMESTAGGA